MNKLKNIVFELVWEDEKFTVKHVGDFNLTLDEMRDTIVDSIDVSIENLKNRLNDCIKNGREFKGGVFVMPYIKVTDKAYERPPRFSDEEELE